MTDLSPLGQLAAHAIANIRRQVAEEIATAIMKDASEHARVADISDHTGAISLGRSLARHGYALASDARRIGGMEQEPGTFADYFWSGYATREESTDAAQSRATDSVYLVVRHHTDDVCGATLDLERAREIATVEGHEGVIVAVPVLEDHRTREQREAYPWHRA